MSSAPRITASCFFLIVLLYLMRRQSHENSSVLISAQTSAFRSSIIRRILAEEHHFVPALDQNLHYVGRWVPVSNRLRWDSAFPGAYIDTVVRNASVIYISLYPGAAASKTEEQHDETKIRRMNFKTSDDRDTATNAPAALTVLLCNGDKLHFESANHDLLAVDINSTSVETDCPVRIVHAGGTSNSAGLIRFKGIWLPNGASLQSRAHLMDEVEPQAVTTSPVPDLKQRSLYRKTMELFTDSLSEHSVTYIPGWLAQVAAQFDVNQIQISTHDHCLTETRMEIRATDVSTQDIFFRSGPTNSTFFAKPWNFHHYIPDILILDLGTIDQHLFQHGVSKHGEGQLKLRSIHQSSEGFTNSFVTAYVALIHQIRRTAYPLHPSALDRYMFDGDGYTYNSAPSTLPIFVMRPLDGSLEQATLSVVEQMQKDGDKSVFWINTSGWVSDMDYDSSNLVQQRRSLTAAGHAKVTSFMHAHLCHYLAARPDQCPFLRRDNYMGNVYVPIEAEVDKVIEESKIRKLTELFWTYE